ncbi:MAG: hypothetical protein JJ863_29450 [Deltaproteobacteria bacterium]|nr:hypothetical protein [Deltaproteobacteria bacterium]
MPEIPAIHPGIHYDRSLFDSDEADVPGGLDSAMVDRIRTFSGNLFETLGGVSSAALTPEMILLMMQRRLDDIDSQISTEIAGIEARADQGRQLAEDLELLGLVQTAVSDAQGSAENAPDFSDLSLEYKGETYSGESLARLLERSGMTDFPGRSVDSHGNVNFDDVSSATIGHFISTKQALQKKVNSQNDLAMSRLQAATGLRGQTIQLGSNLINHLNETAMMAVRNIK